MVNKLAGYIVLRLKRAGAINENIEDIYVYGLHVMMSNIIGIVSAIIVGLVFSNFYEACIFLVSFVITRSFTGGFHARSTLSCFLITVSVMCLAMLVSLYATVSIAIALAIGTLSILITVIFSPIENENKELTNELKKRCRIISAVLVLVQNIIWIILYCFNCRFYKVIVISLALVTLSMAIPICMGRRNGHEENDC